MSVQALEIGARPVTGRPPGVTLADVGGPSDLRAWRAGAVVTQREVAQGAHVSVNTVRRAEAGRRVSVDSARRLHTFAEDVAAGAAIQPPPRAARRRRPAAARIERGEETWPS